MVSNNVLGSSRSLRSQTNALNDNQSSLGVRRRKSARHYSEEEAEGISHCKRSRRATGSKEQQNRTVGEQTEIEGASGVVTSSRKLSKIPTRRRSRRIQKINSNSNNGTSSHNNNNTNTSRSMQNKPYKKRSTKRQRTKSVIIDAVPKVDSRKAAFISRKQKRERKERLQAREARRNRREEEEQGEEEQEEEQDNEEQVEVNEPRALLRQMFQNINALLSGALLPDFSLPTPTRQFRTSSVELTNNIFARTINYRNNQSGRCPICSEQFEENERVIFFMECRHWIHNHCLYQEYMRYISCCPPCWYG